MAQIIEIVFVVDPSVAVSRKLQALRFVGHVLGIGTLAVVENALEQLIPREKGGKKKNVNAFNIRQIILIYFLTS